MSFLGVKNAADGQKNDFLVDGLRVRLEKGF
jgi:hypothetical protein